MADFYDMNAAIQKPNIVNALRQGQQYGMQLKQQQQQVADQNALRDLAPKILGGDPQAYSQAAAIDPEAAGKYQQAGDSQLRRFKNAVDYFDQGLKSGDDRLIQARFREIAPFLSNMTGKPAPEMYTPDMLPAFEQVKTKLAFADQDPNKAELAPRVVGSALVDSTGKVLYQAPPEQKYQWSERAGAWIPMPGAGGVQDPQQGQQMPPADAGAPPVAEGQQITPFAPDVNIPQSSAEYAAFQAASADANSPNPTGQPFKVGDVPYEAFQAPPGANTFGNGQPRQPQRQPPGLAAIPVAGIGPKPDISPAEERRLQLAEEAAARAREAADRSRFGNAPAGFRFKEDGSLEAIPGGPKPAGSAATEGERKAATLLQRLNFSLEQMQSAIKESPSAASPNMTAEVLRKLPLIGEPAANIANPAERQRVESAQLDILDAALTLGTGAAYTKEQLEGYRRAYFPQVGDTPEAIKDKAARLENVIQAAKIAAGRAAPKENAAPAAGGWKIRVKN